MSVAWVLNSLSLFVTTVGVLLIFLYLTQAPRLVGEGIPAETRLACERHRRMMKIAVGLLAGWLLVQYLAVILI